VRRRLCYATIGGGSRRTSSAGSAVRAQLRVLRRARGIVLLRRPAAWARRNGPTSACTCRTVDAACPRARPAHVCAGSLVGVASHGRRIPRAAAELIVVFRMALGFADPAHTPSIPCAPSAHRSPSSQSSGVSTSRSSRRCLGLTEVMRRNSLLPLMSCRPSKPVLFRDVGAHSAAASLKDRPTQVSHEFTQPQAAPLRTV